MDDRIARARVIEIVTSIEGCAAIPVSDVHLSLEYKGKRFGWFMFDHHSNGRVELQCKAPPRLASAHVSENPRLCFIPTTTGWKGWVGVWLDVADLDWDLVREVLEDAVATLPASRRRSNVGIDASP